MKRKIIRQGHNTLTITLPSKWAKRFRLEAGDEVELSEASKSLLITADTKVSGSKVSIDISQHSAPLAWKAIISAYRAGYDEIIVRHKEIPEENRNFYTAFSYDTLDFLNNKNLSTPELIQAIVNRLVGVEIIDHKGTYCIIKELGETTYKEFDNALRRIFLIIKSMGDEINKHLAGDKAILRRIHMEDTNLDRFEDFCIRVLNKRGYEDFGKTPVMHTIIFTLELIGDEYKQVASMLSRKNKVAPQVKKAFITSNILFDEYYSNFYSAKKGNYSSFLKTEQKQVKILNSAKLNQENQHLASRATKIMRFITSLVELKLDLDT